MNQASLITHPLFLLVVIGVVFWALALGPLLSGLQVTQQQYVDLETEVKAWRRLQSDIKTLQAQYAQALVVAQGIDHIIPRRPLLTDILADMERIADVSNVRLKSVGFGAISDTRDTTAKEGPRVISIDLRFEANYFTFKQYAQNLAKSRRLYDVNSARFGAEAERKQSGSAGDVYSMQVIAYFAP